MRKTFLQDELPLDLLSQDVWPKGYYKGFDNLPMDAKIYGFDIETNMLSPYHKDAQIFCVSLSPREKESYVALVSHRGREGDRRDLQKLKAILENPDVIVGGHNVKFDINWVRVNLGINARCMILDSMNMAYLINENIESNSLGFLSRKFEDLTGYKGDINRGQLARMATDDLMLYNAKDGDASRRLIDLCLIGLNKQKLVPLANIASQALPLLSRMETLGVYVDKEWCQRSYEALIQESIALRVKMSDIAGLHVKPESNPALADVLYNKLGFTCSVWTESGKPSTAFEAIKTLYEQPTTVQQEQFLDLLLKYRKNTKLITTYFNKIDDQTAFDGRVHTTYWLGKTQDSEEGGGGTVTGRLSSSDPNLQNIPRDPRVKGMFAATPGYVWLGGDFGQLELRVAAVLAQEKSMLDAFNEGRDIHTSVMADLEGIPYDELVAMLEDKTHSNYLNLKNRRVGVKRINFGVLYGMSAERLQLILRIEMGLDWSLEECQEMIDTWLVKHPRIRQWIIRQRRLAMQNLYVEMPLGQKRRLPEVRSSDRRKISHALKQAVNFPVQSYASWITLIGMVLVDQYFDDKDARIVLQVHDSVESEVALTEDVETIRKDVQHIMEKDTIDYIKDVFGVEFNAPLSFETTISERWS